MPAQDAAPHTDTAISKSPTPTASPATQNGTSTDDLKSSDGNHTASTPQPALSENGEGAAKEGEAPAGDSHKEDVAPLEQSKSQEDSKADPPSWSPTHARNATMGSRTIGSAEVAGVSAFSHQQMAPHEAAKEEDEDDDGGWQTMPAYAQYDLYDDDGKIVARAHDPNAEDALTSPRGGGKGYSRVQDDDAKSTTSMDDNTAYLFKEPKQNNLDEEDDEGRDPLAQMQATKNLLTENQKIAYVGLVRLAIAGMTKEIEGMERTRKVKKILDLAIEFNKKFTQKVMIRLYSHMDLDQAEQVMIEQLAEHGLQAGDLAPSLMANSRVSNPILEQDAKVEQEEDKGAEGQDEKPAAGESAKTDTKTPDRPLTPTDEFATPPSTPPPPPAYGEHENDELPEVQTPHQLPRTETIDIDLRWTVLCDLFLILIADSFYDAPSRVLLERVGAFLDVSWLDICRFEKRVTESLEMEEDHEKDEWTEEEHMETRRKRAKRRRLMMMGLATVGGSLVIGLSAGLLAPVIGAGLAAGFTTIGVTGTSSFLAGAGGAAIVGTTGIITGGTVGAKAANRRTGAVSTFEYRPLYNNKRVNLIVTISGWLIGKVDDVRLPFSTIDPVMGDVYSIWWEPEMLKSMGQTISILATEALTQGLQQILGSTILISLMAALQLPIVLTKLSYLIDNPWSNSLARADRAGLILADSLIDRNLGARPITLVGFSIGSRVIYAALQELSKRGAVGLVQNVYLFGSPMVVNKDDYLKARAVVAGRFVNGYATNDWILGYLFRATAGGIMRVAGLSKVEIPGVENVDLTAIVAGHMAYRTAMPRILREVGWTVTSDEFTEIDDPDPENHEKRQRELISEIEEARRELQEREKNEKKGFSWFRKKKAAAVEKKSWEIYDESSKAAPESKEAALYSEGGGGGAGDEHGSTAVDIDALRREVVELAAKGLEVKQLETTLPPLKLDSSVSAAAVHPRPVSMLRETKSELAVPLAADAPDDERSRSRSSDARRGDDAAASKDGEAPASTPAAKEKKKPPPLYEPREEDITMSFETEYKRPAWPRRFESHLSPLKTSSSAGSECSGAPSPKDEPRGAGRHEDGDLALRPAVHDDHDDDDDEFREKEVEMTFA